MLLRVLAAVALFGSSAPISPAHSQTAKAAGEIVKWWTKKPKTALPKIAPSNPVGKVAEPVKEQGGTDKGLQMGMKAGKAHRKYGEYCNKDDKTYDSTACVANRVTNRTRISEKSKSR